MARIRLVLLFAGAIAAGGSAHAQCRGGGQQGTTGTTGTGQLTGTSVGQLSGTGMLSGGSQMLTGPGSLAYDMLMSQMMARQFAQQQYLLAMQQQKAKQEKLAARRYRAEQTRTQVAESRARTRAALAAQSGVSPSKQPTSRLVAYQPVRR